MHTVIAGPKSVGAGFPVGVDVLKPEERRRSPVENLADSRFGWPLVRTRQDIFFCHVVIIDLVILLSSSVYSCFAV